MDDNTPLRGTCSCGRNHFSIAISSNSLESLHVIYDDRAEHGRALSLRVPLSQMYSTTHAFYPDETHSTIRRVFTPQHAPEMKRHFCGLCGTALSHWSERSPEEAEWVYVNLGSLRNESMERLEDAGLLSSAVDEDGRERSQSSPTEPKSVTSLGQGREIRGAPWFEEIIQGSELGRMKRRKGGGRSADGNTIVEYEVTEFETGDGDTGGTGSGKRKLGSLGEGTDVDMRTGH